MRSRRARILGLALALVALGWSFAAAADEWSFLGSGGEGVLAPSGVAIALAPDDDEGERTVAPPLRLAVPPLVLSTTESPLAMRVPAASRRSPTPDHCNGGPPVVWRTADQPLPLRLAALEDAPAPAPPPGATSPQEQHWSAFLPLLADEARRLGYELPLPFGVSGIYNYLARDIEVTDVRVGVNGAPVSSVSDFANFNARSTVNAALVKTDAWLFPFLNVYLLLGYIHNTSDTNIQVTVPRPGPLPGTRQFNIAAKSELDGFVGGGGVTLAGGYRQIFIMADANYTQTEMGFDDRFRALIASARVGWNGKVGAIPLRLWLGGAYWDTKNTAKSTVEVPGEGAVRFEADQGPKNPWNTVVGMSSSLHRHFELFAEYGFSPGDLTFFAGGLTVRF